MIRITGLTKRFRDKRGEFTVLNNVSVNLPEKGLLFFTGKSGSGKSTFLYLLGGIQGDYGGTIEVDGDIIGTYGEEQWNEYRNGKVGFVFQNYGVFEHGSVMDNVLLPTEISECSGMETEARARELLDYVGLVGFEEVPVSNLSGGEKQRVAIARAMMNYPLIILADEPTGNLDGATSKTILALFRKISETCLVCIVSHDRTAAEEYGDAVYELRDGGLLEIGGNNSLKYDVVVTADGAEKGRATGLSATQLQSYLQKEGLLPEGSSAVTICLRRGCEPVLTDGGPTGKERSEEHGVKRVRIPLSFRSSFKKAFDKGLKGWIRTVAGGVTLALLTGLAFALWNLHMYRPEKAIREYLTDFNVPFVTAEMTRSFRNLYEEEEERTISSGKYYMNELTECLDGNMTIPIIPSANLTDESGVTMVFADIFVSEEILPCCTIRGRKPETPDEIAVSEQIAAEYGITEPGAETSVFVNGKKFRVTGFLHLAYPDELNEVFCGTGDIFGVSTYAYSLESRAVMLAPSAIEEMRLESRSLELPFGTPLYSDWEWHLLDGRSSFYGGLRGDEKVQLLCGRMPEREDEVLVSIETPGAMEMFERGGVHRVLPIHDTKYNESFSDALDLAKFYPQGYRIVGVYDEFSFGEKRFDSREVIPQVLVQESVFQAIKDEYFREYIYGRWYILTEETPSEQVLAAMMDKGFRITEPNVEKILQFRKALQKVDLYLVAALAMIVTCYFLVTVLLVSSGIRDRKFLVGIMRANGYARADIRRIFFCEAALVGAASQVLGLLLFSVAQSYANYDYRKGISANAFDILVFGSWRTVAAAVFFVALFFVAAMIPVVRLSRKTPYELLREGNAS